MRDTNVFLKRLKSLLACVVEFFFSIFRLIQPIETEITTNSSIDVIRFVHEFERKYGKAHLDFSRTDYLTCVNEAIASSRHLLVYLHGDDHEESDRFCRQSLCDTALLEFVSQSRLRCWACNINSDEGARVSRIVREHSYPFVGILMTGSNRRMYLVARSEGLQTGPQLIAFLRTAMLANGTYDNSSISKSDREECTKSVEEQFKYPEHLTQEICSVDSDDSWRVRRRLVLSTLPPLPESLQHQSPVIALRARFASGALIERRFSPSDPVSVLLQWIMSVGDKECPRHFRVVSNSFPSYEIPCRPYWQSGELSSDLWDNIGSYGWTGQIDLGSTGLVSNTTLYVLERD